MVCGHHGSRFVHVTTDGPLKINSRVSTLSTKILHQLAEVYRHLRSGKPLHALAHATEWWTCSRSTSTFRGAVAEAHEVSLSAVMQILDA
ncbi:hypothetical protein BS78_03G008400 [Paspalum vaginatum]|nr:hypothetical protein BS78_03G008400 [Paspalum vaginatum]KAJ1281891.1 hypothetical protein BS78_03G008400 [Paspalum vaginatum]